MIIERTNKNDLKMLPKHTKKAELPLISKKIWDKQERELTLIWDTLKQELRTSLNLKLIDTKRAQKVDCKWFRAQEGIFRVVESQKFFSYVSVFCIV